MKNQKLMRSEKLGLKIMTDQTEKGVYIKMNRGIHCLSELLELGFVLFYRSMKNFHTCTCVQYSN